MKDYTLINKSRGPKSNQPSQLDLTAISQDLTTSWNKLLEFDIGDFKAKEIDFSQYQGKFNDGHELTEFMQTLSS